MMTTVTDVDASKAEELEHQGFLRGKRDTVLLLMNAKFSGTTHEFVQKILAIDSVLVLNHIISKILTAKTAKEIESLNEENIFETTHLNRDARTALGALADTVTIHGDIVSPMPSSWLSDD